MKRFYTQSLIASSNDLFGEVNIEQLQCVHTEREDDINGGAIKLQGKGLVTV